MKRIFFSLIIVGLFALAIKADSLNNATLQGGAGSGSSGTQTLTSGVGEPSSTSTSTSYSLRMGFLGIIGRSTPTSTLPPSQRPVLNSVYYNVQDKSLVSSVLPNLTGELVIKLGTTAVATQTVTTATTTLTVTASNVAYDQAKLSARAWIGTFSSDAIVPSLLGPNLKIAIPGQDYVAGNVQLYATIARSNKVNFRLQNIGNVPTILVLRASETGATLWNNVYYDGTTNITAYVTGNGYEKTLAAGQTYDSIYVDCCPLQKTADNLLISLSLYPKGFADNKITRIITVIPSVSPPGGAPSAAVGYDPINKTNKVYFVINESSLPAGAAASASAEVNVKLYIFNLAGQLVYQKDMTGQVGYNIADVQASLGKGTYVFQIVSDGKIISSGKFVNAR